MRYRKGKMTVSKIDPAETIAIQEGAQRDEVGCMSQLRICQRARKIKNKEHMMVYIIEQTFKDSIFQIMFESSKWYGTFQKDMHDIFKLNAY